MKRATDVVGAAVGLVLAASPIAVIALVIRLTMGRPILFRHVRPGRGGEPFELIKFRTMRAGDAPDVERITRVGGWLRRTSLDELPELWNVLRGDMSLIGPRPLLMEYVPRYTARQARRHEVRPGLSGLAQVSGRNDITWDERLELDVRYVETRSPWLDLRIAWRTVGLVLSRKGIAARGHATTPKFGDEQ